MNLNNLEHLKVADTRPIDQIVACALEEDGEIAVAQSLPFDADEYDFDQDAPLAYDDFYSSLVKRISVIVGKPTYQGQYCGPESDPDFLRWKELACKGAHVDDLTVWSTEARKLYLRLSYMDSGAPIYIGFGKFGCTRPYIFEGWD